MGPIRWNMFRHGICPKREPPNDYCEALLALWAGDLLRSPTGTMIITANFVVSGVVLPSSGCRRGRLARLEPAAFRLARRSAERQGPRVPEQSGPIVCLIVGWDGTHTHTRQKIAVVVLVCRYPLVVACGVDRDDIDIYPHIARWPALPPFLPIFGSSCWFVAAVAGCCRPAPEPEPLLLPPARA